MQVSAGNWLCLSVDRMMPSVTPYAYPSNPVVEQSSHSGTCLAQRVVIVGSDIECSSGGVHGI